MSLDGSTNRLVRVMMMGLGWGFGWTCLESAQLICVVAIFKTGRRRLPLDHWAIPTYSTIVEMIGPASLFKSMVNLLGGRIG